MKIKVNGKGYEVRSLSQLSFDEFNKVLVKAKVSGLDEYLSIFLNMEKVDLMNAKIKSYTVEALHRFIFDIDVTDKVKNPPRVIEYDDRHYTLESLDLDTFGKSYYYDLYKQREKAGQINQYQLYMYALAIALSPTLDDEIEKIHKTLCSSKWTHYLPAAFFLAKKYRPRSMHSVMQSMRFMLGLRLIKWRIRTSKRRSIQWAKI
jgi:hypothetical protein